MLNSLKKGKKTKMTNLASEERLHWILMIKLRVTVVKGMSILKLRLCCKGFKFTEGQVKCIVAVCTSSCWQEESVVILLLTLEIKFLVSLLRCFAVAALSVKTKNDIRRHRLKQQLQSVESKCVDRYTGTLWWRSATKARTCVLILLLSSCCVPRREAW